MRPHHDPLAPQLVQDLEDVGDGGRVGHDRSMHHADVGVIRLKAPKAVAQVCRFLIARIGQKVAAPRRHGGGGRCGRRSPRPQSPGPACRLPKPFHELLRTVNLIPVRSDRAGEGVISTKQDLYQRGAAGSSSADPARRTAWKQLLACSSAGKRAPGTRTRNGEVSLNRHGQPDSRWCGSGFTGLGGISATATIGLGDGTLAPRE